MFETFTAVLMLIVFLVPGFVWRTMEGQFVYLDKRLEWEKFALGLLSRSTFTYLPITPWLYKAWSAKLHETQPVAAGFIAFILVLPLPALLGFITGIGRQNDYGRRIIRALKFGTFAQSSIPTAWDRVFSGITPQWVIVTLRSGGQIYGYLGTNSYASSDPGDRDLYISHTVRMNAQNGLEFVKDTKGIYLRGEDITAIEFLEPAQSNPELKP